MHFYKKQLTSRHPSYICYQSVSDFMKDVGMPTCNPAPLVCLLFLPPIHNLFVFFILVCVTFG